MKTKFLIVLLIVLILVLCAEIAAVPLLKRAFSEATLSSEPSADASADPTDETTGEPSHAPTGESTAETLETQETTLPEPTQETTEPPQRSFTLSFVGDCTLGSSPSKWAQMGTFVYTVGEDYGYPFRNVAQYFQNDDLTIANLEVVLADEGISADKTFTFRGPSAFTGILTEGSVEAVTIANNHTHDFGEDGYQATKAALESAGVSYVEKDTTLLYTTPGGLTVGIYGASFARDDENMTEQIQALREQGAEIIIAAVHWGTEGAYRPDSSQKDWAYAMIDAGVDVVYGHHSHVLQPIETYNGKLIFYSLGNFSFGGNHFPRDMDTVVIQLEVIRDEDGSVSLGDLTIVPCSLSSMPVQNNFQPTPYEEDSKEYERVLSKLDGTFKGADLVVNYDSTE